MKYIFKNRKRLKLFFSTIHKHINFIERLAIREQAKSSLNGINFNINVFELHRIAYNMRQREGSKFLKGKRHLTAELKRIILTAQNLKCSLTDAYKFIAPYYGR